MFLSFKKKFKNKIVWLCPRVCFETLLLCNCVVESCVCNRLVSNSGSWCCGFIHVHVCIVNTCLTVHFWLSGGVGGSCIMFDRTCAKHTPARPPPCCRAAMERHAASKPEETPLPKASSATAKKRMSENRRANYST